MASSFLDSVASEQPTKETESYWLFTSNKTDRNNQTPRDHCGKWMIFEPFDKIDEVWALIKKETEIGELGFSSKVSTMKDKDVRDGMHGSSTFVICVYTYDHTNEEDVMRVRERLNILGFQRKLPYKTDAATIAGAYRSTTGGRVSKWYC